MALDQTPNSTQMKIAKQQRLASKANTAINFTAYGDMEISLKQSPAAVMYYNGGVQFDYGKNKTDNILQQIWLIYGRSPDQVAVILEQLQFLFYKDDVRSTLAALGFIKYDTTNIIPPAPIEGENMTGMFVGIIEFDVRIQIVNPY